MHTARGSAPGRTAWQVLVVVAYLAMIGANALANYVPLFGRSTGEVSDRFDSLFTPAPFTFSVWGVIYLLLAGFVVYQALPRARSDARVARARPIFVLTCVLNVAWLVSWHALAITLSEIVMLGLLAALIGLYLAVNSWRSELPAWQRWVIDIPFAIYLGWISVATIANTSIFLLDLGVDAGTAEVGITVVMVLAATVLGGLALFSRRDWAYALVVAWGLGGIGAARLGDVGTVSTTAFVCAALLAVVAAAAGAARFRTAAA